MNKLYVNYLSSWMRHIFHHIHLFRLMIPSVISPGHFRLPGMSESAVPPPSSRTLDPVPWAVPACSYSRVPNPCSPCVSLIIDTPEATLDPNQLLHVGSVQNPGL